MMKVFQERDDYSGEFRWVEQRLYLLLAFVVTTIVLSVGLVIMDQKQRQQMNNDSAAGSSIGISGGWGDGGVAGDSSGAMPPPPPPLPDICDSSNIAGSEDMRAECAEACRPASCCWSSDAGTSCFASQDRMCRRYSDCCNLIDNYLNTEDGDGSEVDIQPRPRPSDTIIPDPPELLP